MGNTLTLEAPTATYECDLSESTSLWTLHNPNPVEMTWQFAFANPAQAGASEFPAEPGLWPACTEYQGLCFSYPFQATPGDNDFEAPEQLRFIFSHDCGTTSETGCFVTIDHFQITNRERCNIFAEEYTPPREP